MEVIIGYVPGDLVKGQLGEAADKIADECAGILGREKGTIPVMFHKTGADDGNECAGRAAVYYVYAGERAGCEIRKGLAEAIFEISKEYFPDMEKDHHTVIFKLHAADDMGVNGKFEE